MGDGWVGTEDSGPCGQHTLPRRTSEPEANLKKGVGELNIISFTAQLAERAVGSWRFKEPLNHLLPAWQRAEVWQG